MAVQMCHPQVTVQRKVAMQAVSLEKCETAMQWIVA